MKKLNEKERIEKAKECAISKGGKCLSEDYINWETKLQWQCEKEHKWEAIYTNVVNKGTWCPMCIGKTRTQEDKEEKLNQAKEYAKSKNGFCLSEKYVDGKTKLTWKCDNENHKEWKSLWYSIVKDNKWCTECANENIKGKYKKIDGLDIAQKHAKDKGGQCLSTEYINYNEKLKFKCHNDKHKLFFTNLDSILNKGSWCPECVGLNQQEYRTRNLLNYLLKTDFKKVKLEWNINPKTNRLLELDGYSKELNIAFEYQGKQHFKQVFDEDLSVVQERDLIKKQNCIKNNVKLIYINEKSSIRKNSENFFNDIINILNKNKIEFRKDIDMKIVNDIFMNHLMTSIQEEFLKKSQDYAKSHGGKLLSNQYIDSKSLLEWECKNGHKFSRDYDHLINRKSWCSECNNENKNELRLKEIIKYATRKKGECISTEYVSAKGKINLKCKNNHIFISDYDSLINKKSWCIYCNQQERKDSFLKKAQDYAKIKNGLLISTEYISSKTKMKWCCQNNHVFELPPDKVYLGYWCKKCKK